MSSVDERTVKMRFENDEFKRRAGETKGALDNVNRAVDSAGKGKGLLSLNSNMGMVQATASKMAIVTTTALATIANKAVNVGLNLASALTLDPIREGFSEYESLLTKQNVIMNATGKSGTYVKGILNELNEYSDKTIYSFGNMTDAVQKFVNAGVSLPQSVKSIKGIANAAAFAGASSEEANRAMFAFSQSMSLGFIGLQDWNQIENANMGTVQFKTTLLDAAVAAGTLTKKGKEYVTGSGKTISATKGWRDGLQEQWATTKVLNEALSTYSDQSTKFGRKAFKAAQDVRTFTAFMDTLKEGLGSGWSQIFTALFGGLKDSTRMWTGLSNAVGGVANKMFTFASDTLLVWRKLGGFDKTLQGIKNILAPIGALFTAIGDAYRAAFPGSGSKGAGTALYSVSSGFEAITRPLQLVADLIRGSTPAITTFFRIFRIGGALISGGIGQVKDFVSNLVGLVEMKAPPTGGFVGFIRDLAREIGNAIKKVTDLINKGRGLGDAFGSVSFDMPSMPSMPSIGSVFGSSSNGDPGKIDALKSGVSGLKDRVFALRRQSDDVGKSALFNSDGLNTAKLASFSEGVGNVKDVAKEAGGDLKTFGGWVKDAFSWVGEMLGKINFEDVVASFNLAVLAGFMISVTRFINTLTSSFKGFVGVGDGVTKVLESTSGALDSFGRMARAKLIIAYAVAIGVLAVSLWLLSKVPIKNLASALAALAGLSVIIAKTMSSLGATVEKLDGKKISVKMLALSVSMMAMGAAIILLALAMLIMNKVKWSSLAKGLITMKILIVLMQDLGDQAKHAAGNMVAGAIAIGIIAASLVVLAAAFLLFNLVKWESMGKAGATIAVLSASIGVMARLPAKSLAAVGLSFLSMSLGLVAISNALIIFGAVKWESIAKASVVLLALAVSVGVMMAIGGPVAVSGMLGLGLAMLALAAACLVFNSVDWESIGKAVVVLLALLGAAALAATILTAFLYAIAPVSPVLIALGVGFALLGVGLLAFAAAMAIAMSLAAAGTAAFAALATGAAVAIAVFMQTLASEAPILKDAFLDILEVLIDTVVQSVPLFIKGFRELFVAIKTELGKKTNGVSLAEKASEWIEKIKTMVKKKTPEVVRKAKELLIGFIQGLINNADQISAAAARLLIKLLQGLSSKMGELSKAGADVIIEFIKGIGLQSIRLAIAATKTIIQFVNSLADAIENNSKPMGEAMGRLGVAMVKGLITGIGSMAGEAVAEIKRVATNMIEAARSKLKVFSPSRVFREIGKFVVQGLTQGIQNNAAAAITATASMVGGQIAVANEYISKFIQRLDQQSLAARAKADGLARAAQTAAKAASKTKTKTDDRAVRKMSRRVERLDAAADAKERKADSAKAAQDRAEEYAKADTFGKAQLKSAAAARSLDAAKAAEQRAATQRAQAIELDKASKNKGVTPKQRRAMRKEADELRKDALGSAKAANAALAGGRRNAAAALRLQKLAGQQAAEAFQKQFAAEAKADADEKKFNSLSNTDKAAQRRAEATALEKRAAADLKAAKALAYTDLEGANALAALALEEAESAREKREEADQYEKGENGDTPTVGGGNVVDLEPTEAAALAFNGYSSRYEDAMAAAAATPSVEFNQYNTSPENLSPIEVYRQTQNLVNYAAGRLTPTP